MPQTFDEENQADGHSSGEASSATPRDETLHNDEQDGETGVGAKRARVTEDCSDDDNPSAGDGVVLNPS